MNCKYFRINTKTLAVLSAVCHVGKVWTKTYIEEKGKMGYYSSFAEKERWVYYLNFAENSMNQWKVHTSKNVLDCTLILDITV